MTIRATITNEFGHRLTADRGYVDGGGQDTILFTLHDGSDEGGATFNRAEVAEFVKMLGLVST